MGKARVVIRTAVGTSNAVDVVVLPMQPGVFFDSDSGVGAIVAAGNREVTSIRPVGRGETVEIYATGLGNVQPESGGLSRTAALPQVMIAGSPLKM